MGPEVSLPRLQHATSCPYPEPDQSCPLPPASLRHVLVLSSHIRLGFSSVSFFKFISTEIQ